MKNIATALAKAQANMGKALKQTPNPHFRTKYADLGIVMDACLPALNEAGIALIQPTGENEHGRFVETILIHGESGEQLSCRVPLIVSKNDMQGYGSAVTYARRYGLMSMAGIAPEDDDGNAAAKAPPRLEDAPQEPQNDAPKKPQEPPAEVIERAREYLSEADSLDDLKARWGRIPAEVKTLAPVIAAKDAAKDKLTKPILDDEIAY
jgi:hypothetical protein